VASHPEPAARSAGFVDRHRFVILFVTLILMFVVLPIMHQVHDALHPALPPVLEGVVFLSVLVGTVISVSKRRAGKIVSLALGLPTAVLALLHPFFPAVRLAIVGHLFAVAFLSYAIGVMVLFIFTRHRVTFNALCASMCIYLLLGVTWALAYAVVDALVPCAFSSNSQLRPEPPVMAIGKGTSTAVLYFSFTTLTTLGYGDIVPTAPVSRMLSVLEALLGQLYLAVMVARLVGLHIAHSMAQEKLHEPADPHSGHEPSG
jgi:hypothetical protein